jgi:phage shock protein E
VNWLNNLFSTMPEATQAAWDDDALLIDVRTPAEYASGHVEGAFNLPLDRFAQDHAIVAPDKSRQIILYCQSGARSGQALQFLRQQNYERVLNGGSAGAVALKANRPIRRN